MDRKKIQNKFSESMQEMRDLRTTIKDEVNPNASNKVQSRILKLSKVTDVLGRILLKTPNRKSEHNFDRGNPNYPD